MKYGKIEMKKIGWFMLAVSLLCLVSVQPSHADSPNKNNKIIMASVLEESSYGGKALRLIFMEAFKRLDLDLVLAYYPAKRASVLAQKGEVDGELARFCSYNKDCPNLIRVEEAIGSESICAFTTNPDLKLDGWKSLKGTDYRVDYMIGSKIIELKLAEMIDRSRLTGVVNCSQGLKKLHAHRTDVYVDAKRIVLPYLSSPACGEISGIYMTGVMDEIKIHTFLHVKHKALEPKLSRALRQMKEEGLFDKYGKIVAHSYE